jgi:NADP-dependent 3-hydroxy acid dehydrogenase YdfG
MRMPLKYVGDGRGLVKGMEKVGEIAEDDIKVMFDTNVTGLINVFPLPPL